jgi:hypothetical protein
MTYTLSVIATDNRTQAPVVGARVSVEMQMLIFDIPKPVLFQGITDETGTVAWQTELEGIGNINATHEDYIDWQSFFSFSPSNPTALINMRNIIPPQQVRMTITALSGLEGEQPTRPPILVTVNWDGAGGRTLESKKPDANGVVFFDYWPAMAGTYAVTFQLRFPTPEHVELISFPEEGGSWQGSFTLTKAQTDEEIRKVMEETWETMEMQEKVARSIAIALSIIYGMKAIAGFTMQRFSPL